MQDRLAAATAQVIFRATWTQGHADGTNLGFDADGRTSLAAHLISREDVFTA